MADILSDPYGEPSPSHIPEPWEVGYGRPIRPYLIATCDPRTLNIMPTAVPDGRERLYITGGTPTGGGPYPPATTGPANAKRLVDCVNACAGLELPEHLPVGALKVLVEVGLRVLDTLLYHPAVNREAGSFNCAGCGQDLRFSGHASQCMIGDLEQALWVWLPRHHTEQALGELSGG